MAHNDTVRYILPHGIEPNFMVANKFEGYYKGAPYSIDDIWANGFFDQENCTDPVPMLKLSCTEEGHRYEMSINQVKTLSGHPLSDPELWEAGVVPQLSVFGDTSTMPNVDYEFGGLVPRYNDGLCTAVSAKIKSITMPVQDAFSMKCWKDGIVPMPILLLAVRLGRLNDVARLLAARTAMGLDEPPELLDEICERGRRYVQQVINMGRVFERASQTKELQEPEFPPRAALEKWLNVQGYDLEPR